MQSYPAQGIRGTASDGVFILAATESVSATARKLLGRGRGLRQARLRSLAIVLRGVKKTRPQAQRVRPGEGTHFQGTGGRVSRKRGNAISIAEEEDANCLRKEKRGKIPLFHFVPM